MTTSAPEADIGERHGLLTASGRLEKLTGGRPAVAMRIPRTSARGHFPTQEPAPDGTS